MKDKELIRVLNKEIKAGRKWIRLAYKYPDDDSKTEPALRSWLRAIEATDKAKEVSETAMEAAIVRALQAARTPPPGHIIDDAGVVRKVLGVLPVTADGCIAAPGGVIWPQLLIDNDEGGRVAWSLYDICTGDTCDDGEWLADKCYSTREAAEAAKESKA